MGYRSDVFYAVGWPNPDHAKEVLAVYALDQRVRDHKLYEEWKLFDEGGPLIMTYYAESIKWYEHHYDDVQGMERLEHLAEQFWQEREFPYACKFVRIGEEVDDIVERLWFAGDDAESVHDIFLDIGNVSRCIVDFEPSTTYWSIKVRSDDA
jgi:hypothetical protein